MPVYLKQDLVAVRRLQHRKKHVVLDSLANFMSAYNTFFHQGSDLFSDLEPFLKQLQGNMQAMAERSIILDKQLEKRHTYVTQAETLETGAVDPGGASKGKPVKMEGYLFKRGQNAFRTWNRRWFYLSNNKLCYSKRNGEDVTVIEEDLRICLVRPLTDIDRRFCFEIISPTKSHVLQADSEEMYSTWLTSLQQGISSALHEAIMEGEAEGGAEGRDTNREAGWEDSDTEEAQDSKAGRLDSRLGQRSLCAKQILDIPGNEVCADCSAPDPQWASINFGVTLCIECGGIHRSLGVHISKVRSITLDMWEPEILKVMAELGNTIVNRVLEGKAPEQGFGKPGPQASRATREVWIIDKYKKKAFVDRDIFKSREVSDAEAWTVKKLRRRTRGTKKKSSSPENVSLKESLSPDDKDVDAVTEGESSLLESVLRASTLAQGAQASTLHEWTQPETEELSPVKDPRLKVLNAEVAVFGGSLGKQHVASVQLDSDQESTDGESGETKQQTWDHMESFTPELLLYRAARSHNLPLMLEALALGADPQWKNSNEERKSCLHQSILSGSVMATEFLILNGTPLTAVDSLG